VILIRERPMRGSRLHPRPFSFRRRLREIGMFLQGKDEVHKTLRRLAKRLEKAEIPYAIVGGMAVNAHRYRRTTGDVDVLLTAAGLAEFCRRFVPKVYQTVTERARRFVDRRNAVRLDVLVTGRFPGTGQPGPVAFPDPERVRQVIEKIQVVDLATLIQLKLAARRYRDFGDVVELIRFNTLDESFADNLHSSVRADFIECLEEKRREDQYEEREG
jgi:hypothetical protein